MDDIDLENPFPEPVEIEITDVFDLHTIPPRDVKRVVEEYLRLAQRKGFPVREDHSRQRDRRATREEVSIAIASVSGKAGAARACCITIFEIAEDKRPHAQSDDEDEYE